MAMNIAPGAIPMDKLWQEGPERAADEPALMIDVGGFEGPLDLLLHLARSQKVDLARISVLALAEQYLLFVDSARRVRLELAADYLVMAAWLAFLKSKLLIPQQAKGDDGPSGEEMAAALAFRLKRLEAMREAATRIINRNRLGRDVFARGAPEHIPHRVRSVYDASLYDLLSAYANLRQRQAVTQVTIERRKVWSLSDARELLTRMLGEVTDWTALQRYLLEYLPPADRVTATASAFAASLELVREGKIEIRQEGAFQPIYLRNGQQGLPARETVVDTF
ncbi:MAG: segregation/condensation protein A [Alphaproteobacteria bacterium]|uniref:segregation and condensation protein A n=1 Tax=Pseudorhizobium pelagicum TaxID=1509405 RepID=UPI000AC12E87|nr:ScpA family protein [Pseudorhizobium pelagicum]MBU1314970.1 segregation/condensation protein A [Alphaproteobacteria bacterium]MBU1550052.1 segregation/condensation protein A [Alphaproteobacteria bacterium]MBU2337146.1 segregation/condensation protein A [Alphaproteobacteria bacterium]MBU2389477.1 segregation/condensation protein A [Alphaproteobacteria bacterium]